MEKESPDREKCKNPRIRIINTKKSKIAMVIIALHHHGL